MSAIDKLLELQSITGAKDKHIFMIQNKNDNDFCTLLCFAASPIYTYHVSESRLNSIITDDEFPMVRNAGIDNIFQWCDYLRLAKGITNATLSHLKYFLIVQCSPREREAYIKLLSKTLKLGVTEKSINKAIPGLISEWEVQQAYPIDKYPIKPGTEFWLTQKLNGVRATYFQGRLHARSGTPYEGLEHIIDELKWADEKGLILDGELTLLNKENLSDNEAFRTSTGIINSEAEDKTEIGYTVFDMVTCHDFFSDEPETKYSDRRKLMEESFPEMTYTKLLPVLYHGKDQREIPKLLDQMVTEDKEGLMLNTNCPYKRTRHRGILKIKRFYTMDLPIVRCEEGTGRLAGTLGAVVVDYKGNEVNVGSGFTDEQRTNFWANKDKLIGKIVEVKYKEISDDKSTGAESLQFPIFVTLRTDKNTISYA